MVNNHCHLPDGILRHDDQLEFQARREIFGNLDLWHGAEGHAPPVPCSCGVPLALAGCGWGDGHHTRVGEIAHEGEQKTQLRYGHLLFAALVLSPSRGDLLHRRSLPLALRAQILPSSVSSVDGFHSLLPLSDPIWLSR